MRKETQKEMAVTLALSVAVAFVSFLIATYHGEESSVAILTGLGAGAAIGGFLLVTQSKKILAKIRAQKSPAVFLTTYQNREIVSHEVRLLNDHGEEQIFSFSKIKEGIWEVKGGPAAPVEGVEL